MKTSGAHFAPSFSQLGQAMTVCAEPVGLATIRLVTGADGALCPQL